MDAISEARLSELHPELARRIRQLARLLSGGQENSVLRVTQGLRSWTQQQALWAKGRDAAGKIVDPAAVVTQARAGYSWHSFGLAVDVAPFDNAIPDWNIAHPVWKRIVTLGEGLGLVSGAEFRTFPDYPHFQLTGKFPVTPTDEVRQLFLDGGARAVWDESGIETEPRA